MTSSGRRSGRVNLRQIYDHLIYIRSSTGHGIISFFYDEQVQKGPEGDSKRR